MPTVRLPLRAAAATTVLALHALVVLALFTLDRVVYAPRAETQSPFTWIMLPPPAPPALKQTQPLVPPDALTNLFERALVPALPLPPTVTTAPPVTTSSPPDTTILGSIGRSLACTLTRYDQLSAEEKSRCQGELAALANTPAPAYARTAIEERDRREFTIALGEKKAPFLMPCLTAGGLLNIIPVLPCVWKDLTQGYKPSNNPPGRYGEMETAGQ